MNKLLKVVTVVTTLALVLGATFACGFSASALSENVIFDGDVTWSGSFASWYGGLVQVDAITQAIRDEVAANGPISGDEYYYFEVVGTPAGGVYPGFYQDKVEGECEYLEAWPKEEGKGYKIGPTDVDKSGKIIDAGNLVCGYTQFCVFGDEPGGAYSLSHVYISVFRNGGSSTSTTSTTSTVSEVSEVSEVSQDTSSTVESSTIEGSTIGDANTDGVVDMKDILLVRKVVASFTGLTYDQSAADYNGDGTIDLKDVLAIRKAVAA